MSRDNYAEIRIRDRFTDSVIDNKRLRSKADWFEMIEKYGNDFLGLSVDEIFEVFNMSILEVEDYVRRKNK